MDGARRVHELDRPLRLALVGREELGHPLGGRRAARVLEQEGVEEVGAVGGGQPELVGDAHADGAGAQRVARGLALGDVQGIGEGADHPGQRDVLHASRIGRPEQELDRRG
jgi:hypothetical protein